MMPYDINVKSITIKTTTTTTAAAAAAAAAAAETHQAFRRLQAASKKFQFTHIVSTQR
jgi:hypothetical protein